MRAQNEINTYGFETPKKVACKHLYRCCVDHHAFFRMVQTPLIPNGTDHMHFNGGAGGASVLSGRFNSLPHHSRVPPTFTRLPSNRQLRRSFHENSLYGNANQRSSTDATSLYNKRELHRVSIPQNLNQSGQDENNNVRGQDKAPGSPQSSRSMSRSRSQQRGLFGVAPSPRSVRSASRTDLSQTRSQSQNFRHRSSSVESQSSNDSRSCRRHKSGSRHHRRQSDNESEMSRGSGKSGHSHHSHRKQRRHRSRRRHGAESGSENESMKSRNYSGHRSASKDNYELVDSELQWREVQRKQNELKEITTGVQQAAVTKSSHLTAGKASSQVNSASYGQQQRRSKHRRHRSPGENGAGGGVGGGGGGGGGSGGGGGGRHSLWNSELAKHLQFDLIDTAGMSEDQLREIPYTIVETTTPVKLPTSSSLKVHKHHGLGGHRMDRIRP